MKVTIRVLWFVPIILACLTYTCSNYFVAPEKERLSLKVINRSHKKLYNITAVFGKTDYKENVINLGDIEINDSSNAIKIYEIAKTPSIHFYDGTDTFGFDTIKGLLTKYLPYGNFYFYIDTLGSEYGYSLTLPY
jgi:hypothetical protein